MKRFAPLLLPFLFLLLTAQCSSGGFLDDLLKEAARPRQNEKDTFAAGLKEALDIGTRNAVAAVAREDGYFGDARIRIPLPEKLEDAGKILRKVGMGDRVDEFILSMNRAAEKAAPRAGDIFMDAIRDMTVVDAYGIVRGDETAATDYFRQRTWDDLYALFRPVVTRSMAQSGVVQSYRRMMERYNALPLVKPVDVDIEGYVTDEALRGLFFMVAEEEKKIRRDPAARVTELLRKVFGGE